MNTYKSTLINKTLLAKFARVKNNLEESDPMILAKFFNPCGSETWYAIAYNPETKICYGYVTGMWEDELGDFSITELESVKLPFGLYIERDRYFTPCRLSTIINKTP
jgi:hypothetical protein